MSTLEGFPRGWFVVAWSKELEPGGVKPLSYFGTKLVLFRTEDGEAKILDAFCPHLGAHLGIGGEVVGDSIKCPFHAWEFDGAGTCTRIPYLREGAKIPPKATMRAWPVTETVSSAGSSVQAVEGTSIMPPRRPESGRRRSSISPASFCRKKAVPRRVGFFFFGVFRGRSWARSRPLQNVTSGHMVHFGDLGTQMVAPRSITAWA